MSIKMYNYRIRKDAWWSFAAAVREFYLAEYPVFKVLAEVSEGDGITYSKFVEAVDVFRDWTVELQLFDEGDHWLIRPLEQGYFFMNGHEQWVDEFGLETVWYDDRSDVPPEDEKNRPVPSGSMKTSAPIGI